MANPGVTATNPTALARPHTTSSSTWSSAAWATGLLLSLQKAGYKAPVTPTNIANIQRMIAVESSGNTAGFMRDLNPWNLNTYTSAHSSLPGGHIVNEWGVNVQVFDSVPAMYTAYVNQLKANPDLLAVLNNSGSPTEFGGALANSGWKSGSYASASAFPRVSPFLGSSASGSGAYSGGTTSLTASQTAQASIGAQNAVAATSGAGWCNTKVGSNSAEPHNLFTIPHTSSGITYCEAKAFLGAMSLAAGGFCIVIGLASLIVGSLGGRSAGAKSLAPTILVAQAAGKVAGRTRRSAPAKAAPAPTAPSRPKSSSRTREDEAWSDMHDNGTVSDEDYARGR